jgi:hypothetical protein
MFNRAMVMVRDIVIVKVMIMVMVMVMVIQTTVQKKGQASEIWHHGFEWLSR